LPAGRSIFRPLVRGTLGIVRVLRVTMLLVGMRRLRMLLRRVLLLLRRMMLLRLTLMRLMVRRVAVSRRVVGLRQMPVLAVVVACHALTGAPRVAWCALHADDRPGACRHPWSRLCPPGASGNGYFDGSKTTKGRHMERELAAGAKAPAFTLPRDGGTVVSLKDFKGRNLVLYFYPKADTPGCTKEAIAFSNLRAAFARCDTDILGVSIDSVELQDKFKSKHKLKIPLASDQTHKILQAYGAWGEKSMYGRKFKGVLRKTFLIDGEGRIARVWPKVTVPGHAEEVLEAVHTL
jgi:peroxiredoxin Q/BCP